MKRQFEFVAGNSSKFWDVSVANCTVTICFGRIGTSGQSQTKEFADASSAQRHADKMIAEKIRKGYLETAPV
jgi:predicted DNA-binding WGR domain protein